MVTIGDIRRILLLMVGLGGAICMVVVLFGINQGTYTQLNSKDAFLHIQPTAQNSEITFPYAIPGTNLVAEALVHYDGPFMEQGSNAELFNSVALLLHNTSSLGVTKAEIIMQGKEKWCFRAADIPPGATILVVEHSGTKYSDNSIISCIGWESVDAWEWNIDKYLHIDYLDIGTVSCTNITDEELTDICLLYKNWLPQNEIFVGGITYALRIERLAAGQTVILQPEHYAKGYSRFVKIYADER